MPRRRIRRPPPTALTPPTALALPAVLALAAVVALAGLAGCTAKRTGAPAKPASLPAAAELFAATANRLGAVQTVRFAIETSGPAAGVPVRAAAGQLTRAGSAKGSVQLDQGGAASELQFVIVDGTAYIKQSVGGWQQVPASVAATVYDPAAILDPARGLANLVRTARDARTEAREDADGVEAYRVTAGLEPEAVGKLVPGISTAVTGEVWIGVESGLPVRVRFRLPAPDGGAEATVTARFSEYDRPVTISAP